MNPICEENDLSPSTGIFIVWANITIQKDPIKIIPERKMGKFLKILFKRSIFLFLEGSDEQGLFSSN